MFSLKYTILFALLAMSSAACRFWQAKPAETVAAPPVSVEEVKNRVPFATKEPETYQAEIHVSANNVENVIFTARNGANRLIIYEYQTDAELAILQNDGGKSFLIARQSAVCTENQTAGGAADAEDVFPTAELLNEEHSAVYESLGAENGAAKYSVRFDDSPNSEIVITVDENINLPVKQEFYSVAGERKNLVSTTELKNFSLNTDAQNFELPKNCVKVSPTEFQQMRRRELTK